MHVWLVDGLSSSSDRRVEVPDTETVAGLRQRLAEADVPPSTRHKWWCELVVGVYRGSDGKIVHRLDGRKITVYKRLEEESQQLGDLPVYRKDGAVEIAIF